jgi:uncharacterized membrane protein YphA (DoxX/SURF4 family)
MLAENNLNAKSDAGLLILRLGVALPLLIIFGLPKVIDAAHYLRTGQWGFIGFNRRVGLPLPVVAAFLQTFNESLCALFLACGFYTRFCAITLGLGFLVATACSLKLSEPSWILAAVYAVVFISVALLGPGRYSVDSFLKLRQKKSTATRPSIA